MIYRQRSTSPSPLPSPLPLPATLTSRHRHRHQIATASVQQASIIVTQAVGTVGLSELSDVGLLSELSDCRTDGRQWKTVDERGTMSCTVGITVGHCRTCRTVGLSDLSDCRITVGKLSDCCRITVGIYCRTVGPGLRFQEWCLSLKRRLRVHASGVASQKHRSRCCKRCPRESDAALHNTSGVW